jgi:hypothetical protein
MAPLLCAGFSGLERSFHTMSRRAAILAVLPVLLLAACETQTGGPGFQPPPLAPPPPPPPPGGIDGHGAFRLSAGARVTCAGYSVALMPDFVRYRRRIEALYGATDRVMEPIDEVKARSAKLPPSPDTAPVASTTCDARGGFSFRGLNPGGYFLLARVRVRPPIAGGNDFVVLQPVDIQPDQNTDVTLAP